MNENKTNVFQDLLELELEILEDYIDLHDDFRDEERQDDERIKEDFAPHSETEPCSDGIE